MNVAALIRILGAKGMSASDIADVVELAMPEEPSRADRKRERDRDRIAAKRDAERLSQESRDMSDIARQSDTLSEGSQGSPKPLPNPPNLSQEPPIVPQKSARKASASVAFEQFWTAYPRKVAKGDAEKAFPKALALTDLETLIASATLMGRVAEDVKFIPHAASWLNGKRWLDTHDPPKGASATIVDADAVERRRAENRRLYGAET